MMRQSWGKVSLRFSHEADPLDITSGDTCASLCLSFLSYFEYQNILFVSGFEIIIGTIDRNYNMGLVNINTETRSPRKV